MCFYNFKKLFFILCTYVFVKCTFCFNLIRASKFKQIILRIQCMQEKKIQVGDYQINYLKVGNGPYNLLFMPGALGSIWTDFAPQIKGLSKDLFTLIAWDPPGYGKSIPPVREFPINFYEKDADTALLLMRVIKYLFIYFCNLRSNVGLIFKFKALDLQKFSLLGWSDGGISSIFLAAKYPKNVKKAVIWGANSHILKSELKLYDSEFIIIISFYLY